MKEFAIYTLARLGLFLACYAVFALVWGLVAGWDGATFIWPFILALVVSSVLSLRLLTRQREAFARRIDDRARRATSRFDEIRSREDAE